MGIVQNIKMECDKAGMTITDLEKRAGLSDNSIYKWDTNTPAVDRVYRVAKILEVPVEKLLEEAED